MLALKIFELQNGDIISKVIISDVTVLDYNFFFYKYHKPEVCQTLFEIAFQAASFFVQNKVMIPEIKCLLMSTNKVFNVFDL